VGAGPLTLEDVLAVALEGRAVALAQAPAFRAGLAEMAGPLPWVEEDRPLDADLAALAGAIQGCRWSLYP